MALSQSLVEELRDIFREDYGLDMQEQDAEKAAAWLTAFFDGLADASASAGE